jgi:DNA repair exonuclease SbcCD ATPase subunit
MQNGLDETENRVTGLSGSLEALGRALKDFKTQTQVFEKADELKLNLERSMDTLKAELSRVEEHRTETAKLETDFIKVRRLEDEVNTKMTNFLVEKSRLDAMEKDFERLIATSLRVEERLKEVTGADDTLQKIQVAMRKLEDAITAAEDRYQRVESKNQVLEETNHGIEQNFKIMGETELALRKCRENIDTAEDDLDSLRPAIEDLAAASEKARQTEEKLRDIDTNLTAIEERIEKMQTARQWLANAETRFDELNREANEKLNLMKDVLKGDKKGMEIGKGAPPISVRENVVRLARQGWGPEEIARNLKISRGEVELILEMGRP